MLVRDVMTTDLVTVDVDGTVADVVGALLDNEVGSAIVVDDGTPTGLVTESDALRAGLQTGDPLAEIPIRPLCGRPLVTTGPGKTIQTAVRRMIDEDVKKLPVLDDLDLVGIVTFTDVVFHLSDLRKEAADLASEHYNWHR